MKILGFIFKERNKSICFKLGKSKNQKNNVFEITFNNYGIVETKKFYQLNNMNDLKIVKETTQKKI